MPYSHVWHSPCAVEELDSTLLDDGAMLLEDCALSLDEINVMLLDESGLLTDELDDSGFWSVELDDSCFWRDELDFGWS